MGADDLVPLDVAEHELRVKLREWIEGGELDVWIMRGEEHLSRRQLEAWIEGRRVQRSP